MTKKQDVVIKPQPKKDETFTEQPVEIPQTVSQEQFMALLDEYDSICIQFYQYLSGMRGAAMTASKLSATLTEIANTMDVRLNNRQLEKLQKFNEEIAKTQQTKQVK